MKRLKFSDPLPELILKGDKRVTWRIDDDKDIVKGDTMSLCYEDGKEFGVAKVVSVNETVFGELSAEDRNGHEEYPSDEIMYRTYSEYYEMDVLPFTKVKVIRFELK